MYDSVENIKKSILFELGYPFLRVELNDEMLEYIINKQLLYYTNYVPYVKTTVMDIGQPKTTIELQDDENRKILGIGMIITSVMLNNQLFIPTITVRSGMDLRRMQEDLKIRILSQQLTELVIKDFFGVVHTYRYDPSNQTIYCSPEVSGRIYISYYTNYKDISEVKLYGQKWIFKYQLQLQKYQLGRLRSKYSGIPTLIGELNTDGETLLNEQKEEIQQLEEELKNMKFTFIQNIKFIG